MPVNWPPASALPWPPAEIQASWLSYSNWQALAEDLQFIGFTLASPTVAERNLYFPNSVRCDDNHQISGAMLVSPDGLRRWPFCRCNNAQHKELLVLWPPYTCGSLSGPDNF
jgi:hypothetical protein